MTRRNKALPITVLVVSGVLLLGSIGMAFGHGRGGHHDGWGDHGRPGMMQGGGDRDGDHGGMMQPGQMPMQPGQMPMQPPWAPSAPQGQTTPGSQQAPSSSGSGQ